MDRPRVKFGGQTGEEAEGNLTLASLIRDQRGNPALTAWEEGFLTISNACSGLMTAASR
jgi:hypothetical protein